MSYPEYQANVQKMCDAAKIPNPIQEEDLSIYAVSFLVDRAWIKVWRSDMNRAGRFFFQWFYSQRVNNVPSTVWEWRPIGKDSRRSNHAKRHFAELWDLPEDKVGLIVRYAKVATHVTLHWK